MVVFHYAKTKTFYISLVVCGFTLKTLIRIRVLIEYFDTFLANNLNHYNLHSAQNTVVNILRLG